MSSALEGRDIDGLGHRHVCIYNGLTFCAGECCLVLVSLNLSLLLENNIQKPALMGLRIDDDGKCTRLSDEDEDETLHIYPMIYAASTKPIQP